MKFRLDFVTNSSSSSYIVARKGTMNEKQKEEILRYVEQKFLSAGRIKGISTVEELDDYANEYDLIYEGEIDDYFKSDYDKAKQAIENGMTVYCGTISHDSGDDDVSYVYEDIWRIMDQNDRDGNFMIINDDLSY